MKIAVLIPDRSDRPEFLRNCIRMMGAQTLTPAKILVVDRPPLNCLPDITMRYRLGYEELSDGDYDLIAFIENDDYYAPNYLQTMADNWVANGRPDMIGTSYTVYYHIGLRKYFTMTHLTRSSAMSTLIRPGLDIKWCIDTEPYTDMHLWSCLPQLSKVIITPPLICVGIKHGTGLCGGKMHIDKLHRYVNDDPNFVYLRAVVNHEAAEFYTHHNEAVHSNN